MITLRIILIILIIIMVFSGAIATNLERQSLKLPGLILVCGAFISGLCFVLSDVLLERNALQFPVVLSLTGGLLIITSVTAIIVYFIKKAK